MTLAFALLLSLAGLALLWCGLAAGLSLYLALLDRWSEACRDSLASERMLQAAQQHQRQLEQQRRQRERERRQQRGWTLVDPDGRRRWLDVTELEGFARLCRQELGLAAACGLRELRRHWRRRSLEWHPDRGGDPQAWLRRLRAYEALCQLAGDPRLRLQPPALMLPAPLRRGGLFRRKRLWRREKLLRR